jgi:hypothetical protein
MRKIISRGSKMALDGMGERRDSSYGMGASGTGLRVLVGLFGWRNVVQAVLIFVIGREVGIL